jgi:RNA-directed DNA polymerase
LVFGQIANFQALHAAAHRAVKGKRKKSAAASFFANLEGELLALERQLRAGEYRLGRYVAFEVNDPKKRIVSAARFRDRVVHHALCAVVEPIFEAGFIDHTFANRTGKGTHSAIEAYERYRDRHAHVLRCDIYRYFPGDRSYDPEIRLPPPHRLPTDAGSIGFDRRSVECTGTGPAVLRRR